MENQKLEQGEEYLSIQIVGLNKLVAFKNKGKTDPKQPDFISNGVAVWISKKK
jgi:hypothetical protein